MKVLQYDSNFIQLHKATLHTVYRQVLVPPLFSALLLYDKINFKMKKGSSNKSRKTRDDNSYKGKSLLGINDMGESMPKQGGSLIQQLISPLISLLFNAGTLLFILELFCYNIHNYYFYHAQIKLGHMIQYITLYITA